MCPSPILLGKMWVVTIPVRVDQEKNIRSVTGRRRNAKGIKVTDLMDGFSLYENRAITMKKSIFTLCGVCLVFLAGAVLLFWADDDCDRAVQKVRDRVGEFKQLPGEIGRCDGVCIERSVLACTISDDFSSWVVTPWGSVTQK